MDHAEKLPRFHSTCPHDCPSTCALEVERIDDHTIGRVYGAKGNDYTAGVICAKVARYAERVHHPDRLRRPLRRTGAKGDLLVTLTIVEAGADIGIAGYAQVHLILAKDRGEGALTAAGHGDVETQAAASLPSS